jgi:hypothetical protein
VVSLSWEDEDIENRWGWACSRAGASRASTNFLRSRGGGNFGVFIWLMFLLDRGDSSLKHIGKCSSGPATFRHRPGHAVFLLGCGGFSGQNSQIALQRRALDLAAVPQHREFVLNETTAKTVLDRVRSLVDDTRYFILLNRIDRALSNLHNIGGVSDVSTILKAQSENDENQVASSYAIIHAMIWAIPVLGFVGTVLGLSIAIRKFTGALRHHRYQPNQGPSQGSHGRIVHRL